MNILSYSEQVVLVRLHWLQAALETDKTVGFLETCAVGSLWRQANEDKGLVDLFVDEGPLLLIALRGPATSTREAKLDFLAGLLARHLTAR